ncbi:MAG: arginine--tRNA ligase [Acidimicrobiales bacterium]
MAGLLSVIDSVLAPAFASLEPGAPSGLRPSQRADFQVDGALALARSLGRPPREVAEEVLKRAASLGLYDICDAAEVAGPGFINLTVSTEFLARQLLAALSGPAPLGVERVLQPRRVVVDYGGPNAAKQMHVGHLRSAIIGDSIVRLLELRGHEVLRENHIGDWGAPFGMLIEHLNDLGEQRAAHELAVGDLEAFYQAARSAYDNDPAFAGRARARVVLLQSGEPETLQLWKSLVRRSVAHFDDAFRRLGTKLTSDDVVGESHYSAVLPEVVAELQSAGLLVESDGALCAFPPGHTNREGTPLPLIIQNSVGGYTYAATDLAAVRDRTGRLGATLLVYVVGFPQAEHFEMVFATARSAGWLPEGAEAVHVAFGNVLGPDGKMFRTRQGGTVKLSGLLDEAISRAKALIVARAEGPGPAEEGAGPAAGPRAPAADLDEVARAVGIGAVKYADLSTDRVRDYRFDWDRMLSFDGNTAPYIQYAHARICSVFRRAGGTSPGTDGAPAADPRRICAPGVPEERQLAKALLGFPDAIEASLQSYSPHKLCGYLFELAGTFTDFYEHCPILRAATPELRSSRLALSAVTAAVLAKGLELLGIEAPERM